MTNSVEGKTFDAEHPDRAAHVIDALPETGGPLLTYTVSVCCVPLRSESGMAIRNQCRPSPMLALTRSWPKMSAVAVVTNRPSE